MVRSSSRFGRGRVVFADQSTGAMGVGMYWIAEALERRVTGGVARAAGRAGRAVGLRAKRRAVP